MSGDHNDITTQIHWCTDLWHEVYTKEKTGGICLKCLKSLNMSGCHTGVLVKAETSKAEVNPPLFPDVFLHQTVEEEDEKSWNINKSEM